MIRTLRTLSAEQILSHVIYGIRGHTSARLRPKHPPEMTTGGALVPFLKGPAHASWDDKGGLELIHQRVDFSSGVDWSYAAAGSLWTYQLHNFDHLRGEGLSREFRTEVLMSWIRNHRSGVGWDPHPTSLRLLSWGKLLLSPGSLLLDDQKALPIYESMAQQADCLKLNLEVRLQTNHLFSNLVGLVFAGLLFSGERADFWLKYDEDLIKEMRKQFNSDGGHEERSPMYHCLLVENLLDVLNLARVRPERASARLVKNLEETIARSLSALKVWLQPDGRIALFADSSFGVASEPDSLLQYALDLGVLPREFPGSERVLMDTGYARLEAKELGLIASVAGPMPAHNPGHAHCDALGFELWCGSERVVTDTGVYEYLSGPRREISRETLSHATLKLGATDQAEVWSAHRVGGRPEVKLLSFEDGHRFEASCRGWATRENVHHRIFMTDGRDIEVQDRVEGPGIKTQLSLPLAPGIRARLVHDPDGDAEVHLALESGRRIRICLPIEAEWRIEPHVYFPEFGVEVVRQRIVGESDSFESGRWRFELLE